MMKTLLETLNYQPTTLLPNELENPYEAVADLFEQYELHQIRADLYEFYKSWVNSNTEAADGKYHAEMLLFYNSLVNFVNGAYLYTQQNEKNLCKHVGSRNGA